MIWVGNALYALICHPDHENRVSERILVVLLGLAGLVVQHGRGA
jgi:hypothetical protein